MNALLSTCAQCLSDAESRLQEISSMAQSGTDSASLMEALSFVHQAQMAVSRALGSIATAEQKNTGEQRKAVALPVGGEQVR